MLKRTCLKEIFNKVVLVKYKNIAMIQSIKNIYIGGNNDEKID